MSDAQTSGSGRETRLLLLVIVVAVTMLLILAQFRYPAPDPAVAAPVAGPIERLAARATFEELALIMADVAARVQPALTILQIERVPPPVVRPRRDASPPVSVPPERRSITALRVDADLAIAYLPEGFRVVADSDGGAAVEDEARRLVLARVEALPFAPAGPVATISGPGYLAVFEGARGGPAVRPLFVGRVDELDDPRWTMPVLAVGGDPQLNPGAFVYALDGRLVGMTIPDASGVAIVRTPALLAAVEALRIR